MTADQARIGAARKVRGHALRFTSGVLLPAILLAGCSADATRRLPTPGAVAPADAACAPGTFIGSMTLNCPQPAR